MTPDRESIRESAPEDSARKTYLYLRVGVVSLAIFLAASLAIEMASDDSTWLGSISAYYYTAVRSVFVGSLVAMGLCLITIKGRDFAAEDLLLNLAGMCAPVVALVPTPLEDDPRCPSPARCVPPEFIPGVENNIKALLVVGVLGLLFAAVTVRAHRRLDLVAFALAAVGFIAFALVFATKRDAFLDYAHYGTAIPMFGLIVAVTVVNAVFAEDFVDSGGTPTLIKTGRTLRNLYWMIAALMTITIVAAVVIFLVKAGGGPEPGSHWVFVIEAILLFLFSAFWVLQTLQYAEDGDPVSVRRGYAGSARSAGP